MTKTRELRTQYYTTKLDEIDEFEAAAHALGLRNYQLLAHLVHTGLQQLRNDPTHREVVERLIAARQRNRARTTVKSTPDTAADLTASPTVVDLDERRRRT